MSDEQEPWARQPGEPLRWFGRFERYLLMWPHSVVEVYRQEWRQAQKKQRKTEENRGENDLVAPEDEEDEPKEAPGYWYPIIRQWQWRERVAAYDALITQELHELHKIERKRTLEEDLAQMHRRVQVLNAKALQLLGETQKQSRVWLKDAKLVGAVRVDLVRFNAPLFEQLRGVLSDIAAEVGERVKKKEVTRKEMPPNVYGDGFNPDQDGVDDRESEEKVEEEESEESE